MKKKEISTKISMHYFKHQTHSQSSRFTALFWFHLLTFYLRKRSLGNEKCSPIACYLAHQSRLLTSSPIPMWTTKNLESFLESFTRALLTWSKVGRLIQKYFNSFYTLQPALPFIENLTFMRKKLKKTIWINSS